MDVRVGPLRRLSAKALMLSKCGPGKDSESPLDSKEIKPFNPKGNQPWIFVGRADAEAKVPTLWPPDANSWLIGKDPDAGKDWRIRRGRQRMGWLDSIINSMDISLNKLREIVKNGETWHAAVHGVTKFQTWMSDWTMTTKIDLNAMISFKNCNYEWSTYNTLSEKKSRNLHSYTYYDN